MHYVPKGTNRAFADRKTARHAQRTPLPPRSGQVDDAKEAIGMAKKIKKDKGKKGSSLQDWVEIILPDVPKGKEGKKDKGRREEKASAKALRKAEKVAAPAVVAPARLKEPKVGGDAHPKAEAFYADARAAGWEASLISRGEQVRSDVVTALRGTESIVIEWQNGVFIPPCLYTRPDGSETKPRNASDARKIMEAPAPSSDALAARAAVRAKIGGGAPRARSRSFAFDPSVLSDRELAEALIGCKVVWVNRISGMEDEEQVRGRVTVHDGTSGRQVTFLGSAYRTVLVSSITSVTGGKRLAKV